MSVLKDRRRILGPTDSVPVHINNDVKSKENERMRAQDEIRKIFLQRGVVANSTGSCYLELENHLRLQCTVNGPKPIRGSFTTRADLSVEVQFAKFGNNTHQDSLLDDDELSKNCKNFASFLQTALTPAILLDNYPKSAISIVITVLSSPNLTNDKSLLAASVTCASVALADSGISISDVVTAGAVSIDQESNNIYYDPECVNSDDSIDAVVSYMCAASTNELSAFWLDGTNVSPKDMDNILKSTKQIAIDVRKLVNNELVEDLKSI